MEDTSFVIETSESYTDWAEMRDGRITLYRTSHGSDDPDSVLVRWDVEVLRSLLTWASQESSVNAYFAGPMAHQIHKHSKELGMTPEMFVWHAVKVFIEVGSTPQG